MLGLCYFQLYRPYKIEYTILRYCCQYFRYLTIYYGIFSTLCCVLGVFFPLSLYKIHGYILTIYPWIIIVLYVIFTGREISPHDVTALRSKYTFRLPLPRRPHHSTPPCSPLLPSLPEARSRRPRPCRQTAAWKYHFRNPRRQPPLPA